MPRPSGRTYREAGFYMDMDTLTKQALEAARSITGVTGKPDEHTQNVAWMLTCAAMAETIGKIQALEKDLSEEFRIMQELASELPAIKGRRNVKNGEEIEEKYYSALRRSQEIRDQIRALDEIARTQHLQPNDSTQYAKELEEKRAIKEATVTSTTYQRAQKRLFKDVDGFLSKSTR